MWVQIPLLSFSWWFKPRFKSKFEWTSVHISFNPDLNEAQKKRYMKNDKIISLTNLLQHSLSAEFLSEWNFQINARNKLTAKCLLTFSHYTRPHLEYGSQVQVKNKLDFKMYLLVYKFNVCFIRLENLVYQNNSLIIYTAIL